jgi:hypothetical protein
VEKNDKTWRVHECRSCGKIFVSVQQALSTKDAAAWVAHFDPPIQPESGLTSKPVSEDSPLRRLDEPQAS